MPLQQLATVTSYNESECAAFMRSRERYGDLSNMTHGFPIEVNGMSFQSSEGLYQAMKFPHNTGRQLDIAHARSGMDAKKVAYLPDCPLTPDWDDFRIDAMAVTVALKLLQHPDRFGQALVQTSGLTIVEKSYRDDFWGAHPCGNNFTGANVLGKLLQIMADQFNTHGLHHETTQTLISQADTSKIYINGQPVPIP